MTDTGSPHSGQGLAALPEDLRQGVGGHLGIRRPGLALTVGKILITTRVQAVLLFRLSQTAHRLSPVAGSLVKYINHVLTGADIAAEASIGPGLVLYHPTGVVIGPDCHVGRCCVIMNGVTLGHGDPSHGELHGSPRLGDRVYVAPGAHIFGPVVVGSDAIVAANAVVLADVPPGSLAVGAPAVIRERPGA